MIHPTRTQLLQLKARTQTVHGSLAILQARRQVLLKEFLACVKPFVASRDALRRRYHDALAELDRSRAIEGDGQLHALAAVTGTPLQVEVTEQNIMGVHCREVTLNGSPRRTPLTRPFDATAFTPHLSESLHHFEVILDEMEQIAAYENKIKRLGEEIQLTTRRIRVLEERIIPRLQGHIRTIRQYLGEREREDHYRLKHFKQTRQ